nr:hypothetical protein [uncultured Psychroserpens sp.]
MKTISKLTGTQNKVTNATAFLGLCIVNALIASFIVLALMNGIH